MVPYPNDGKFIQTMVRVIGGGMTIAEARDGYDPDSATWANIQKGIILDR
jgi:hypothetical protein